METNELTTLFINGGISLSFIGFLIWLIKYFMAELNAVRQENKDERTAFMEVITNHINTSDKIMEQQIHTLETLSHNIEIACRQIEKYEKSEEQGGITNDEIRITK